MIITSLDNKEVKRYFKLKQKKYRDIEGLFLVEGEHLVLEANKAGLLIKVITTDEAFDYSNKIIVTKEIMKKISNLDTPPKVIGICKLIEERELKNKLLVLDGVQDPGNLGTIIRSAVAFNFDTIILSNDTVDMYNPKVIRSTQGMLFHINIIRRNLNEVIPKLKEDGYFIYTTDVSGGEDIRNIKIQEDQKIALVMGNEGNGVSDNITSLADKKVYIKMNPLVESLNVGVATSILLYELKNNMEEKYERD